MSFGIRKPKEPKATEPAESPTELTEGPADEKTETSVAPIEAEPPVPPEPEVTRIALDVFCRISGRRPDQNRGFSLWAKKQGLRLLTREEWEAELSKYLARPV